MTKPRICVLRAPGTNCDFETEYAFNEAGGFAERVHINRVLETPSVLKRYQILCFPGGFSYGDDIGAGVIFSRQLSDLISVAIGDFMQQDKLILGICNGFQVLLKAGILPDGTRNWPWDRTKTPPATLTWNENGKYTDIWVKLKVHAPKNVFLEGLDEFELPLAHAEGKLVLSDRSVIDGWQESGIVALRYWNGKSHSYDDFQAEPIPYPHNPNGSEFDIAALGDSTGRFLGLMPHPDRFLFATQHPKWTRNRTSGEGTGMKIFRNAVGYFD